MIERDIFAGFGGQGVLLMGQLLAQAALFEGHNVAWLPSYGPEMRGGTANCSVTISDKPVASPIIDHPTSLIAMNAPSLDKFEQAIIPNGKLFVNSSIIPRKTQREDLDAFYIPCTEIAVELGQLRLVLCPLLAELMWLLPNVSARKALSRPCSISWVRERST